MKIPSHLAIIMDGNGRWAQANGRERTFGHLRGARVAKTIIEHCTDIGVKHLTLYAFSTENWLRPKHEVYFLMQLLARHLRHERRNLIKNNIRFTTIGDLGRLPTAVAIEVERTIAETATNTGLHLVFALSYGGRQEITAAFKTLAKEIITGRRSLESIDESVVSGALETSDMPDPDLIIRTSGENRLSNFLLWQAAYSELHITDTLWPDFTVVELERIFNWYSGRERRFGRISAAPESRVELSRPSMEFDDFQLAGDGESDSESMESDIDVALAEPSDTMETRSTIKQAAP